MKFADYQTIRSLITAGGTPKLIADKFPHVLYDSIVSMWSSHWQESEMKELKQFRNSIRKKEECTQQFFGGKSLLSLAVERGLSPCALARLILTECGYGKDQIKEAMKRPGAIEGMQIVDQPTVITRVMNRPPPTQAGIDASARMKKMLACISNERWAKEIRECVENDAHNSPFLDVVKNLTGREYESLLESYLHHQNLPFVTEEAQRLSAKVTKTPDILLASPILVHGRVVNWIDSKAHFADPATKRKQLDEQLRPYVNRIGPGLVIYWLDFVEGENNPSSVPIPSSKATTAIDSSSSSSTIQFSSPALDSADGMILFLTNFPDEFQTMDQLLAKELKPTSGINSSTQSPVASSTGS